MSLRECRSRGVRGWSDHVVPESVDEIVARLSLGSVVWKLINSVGIEPDPEVRRETMSHDVEQHGGHDCTADGGI